MEMSQKSPRDLFAYAEQYPNAPAQGVTETSRAAAALIAHEFTELQELVYKSLQAEPGTFKEVMVRIDRPRENVQPRFSELKLLGLIFGTGEKRERCEVYSTINRKDNA